MKALTTILAASAFFSNVAIAADSQAAAAAAPAAAVQQVTITKTRSRAEVQAEAVEAMKNHKTALAVQLEQYQ